MASYQVPQFLDSGEKIFLNMNIRQFAYALAGFFITLIFYNIINSVSGLGVYSIIPCLPIIGVFTYLAIGKYNGRDTEVYVFKMIIYLTKPRLLKYTRQPDYTDINNRLSEWTVEKVMAKWNMDQEKQKEATNESDVGSYNSRISQIRKLSRKVDQPTTTIMTTVIAKEKEMQKNQAMIQKLQAQQSATQKAQQSQNQPSFKFEAPKFPTIKLALPGSSPVKKDEIDPRGDLSVNEEGFKMNR